MIQADDNRLESRSKHTALNTILRVARYLFVRVLTIAATIFVGIFITVSIANANGDLGSSLGQASGPALPFWPRTLLLTGKALNLDLGDMQVQSSAGILSSPIRDILLEHLSRSLRLIAPAFLLLFLLGLPLALALFRKPGSFLDRLATLLVPISSIPSWVLAILLILIFSIETHLLPPGGMFDAAFNGSGVQLIFNAVKHVLLPVLAIFLSLFFQCVYAWRTFLLLYADENYLELAKAKGLSERVIDQRYVLRPTLPYIITSFSMLLVGLWQTTAALEYIFGWPGIGLLYINSLPNALETGQQFTSLNIVVGIVVLFAYLLGATALILDIIYAIVDPRIRIGNDEQTVRPVTAKKAHLFRRSSRRDSFPDTIPIALERSGKPVNPPRQAKIPLTTRIRSFWDSLKPVGSGLLEILRNPAALIGLFIIMLLIVGSILAVTLFPYNRLGELWNSLPPESTGINLIPRYAQPFWVNWFRLDKVPETIVLDSSNASAQKKVRIDSSGMPRETITFTFNNNSSEFPQDVCLYFDAKFAKKQPFVAFTWTTPDGRVYPISGTSVDHSGSYSLSADQDIYFLTQKDSQWNSWFQPVGSNYPTPLIDLLYAVPHVDKPLALKGTYQLQLVGYTFEKGSDIHATLVVLGRVYGWGGSDYLGRNLLIPLLWGMPFALLIGLVGATLTSLISIILAAAGVWYGGWVDTLIQRLVEANMILPVVAICVLVYAYFNTDIWVILWIVVLLNVFGSPIKTFRAALLQVKNAPYIESARVYNASNGRIIFHYLVPRILPVFLPQFVSLIPSYVFLEATLGILGISSPYPTWGSIIYSAIRYWGNWGNAFWVLEPIGLLLLTGFAFTMLGFALEKILNPRLKET
jgi:peptide/nickel transport system permease protein